MEINPSIAEIWSLYAIATTMIALRVFCRTKMVGVSGFRPDDYLVFFAWVITLRDGQCDWELIYRVLGRVHDGIDYGDHVRVGRPRKTYFAFDT